MCLLSYYPPGKQPDPRELHSGAAVNRDGYGFAIVDAGALLVRKGLDADRLIAEFIQARQEHPGGPAMFHSRLGTGGVRTTFNCHPFYVGDDKLTVVAHNGILFGMPRGEARCDTHSFAATLLPEWFGEFDHYRLMLTLERWVGGGNKLVILTANPKYDRTSYLINADRGRWTSDGVWHSNSDYVSYQSRYRETLTGALISGRGVRCQLCLKRGTVDPDTAFCGFCNYCNDCLEPAAYCLCFSQDQTASNRPPVLGTERLAITAGTSAGEEAT